ncbi:MAG: FtsX-like permease family protein [Verrucomicrobiaceae bacterium]|nr:FtsX-like permease family protein [Verrucomicrobiaceae bacterium]
MTSAPLFLAIRYLRPTRSFISVITVISMLGVMLGVGVLVTVMSVFKGWQIEYRRMVMGFEPHVVVMQLNNGGETGPQAPQPVDWRPIRDRLAALPEIASATPVAEDRQDGVAVENEGNLQGISILGLPPGADNALAKKLEKHLVSENGGKFDLNDDNIILPDFMAKKIGAKLGDTLVVHAGKSVQQFITDFRAIPENEDDSVRAEKLDNITVLSKELKLVGILRADTAGYRGYVPLNIAQEFFNLDSGITGINLELRDPEHADEFMERLYAEGLLPPEWGWTTWEQEHRDMLESVENQRIMMYFLLIFIMIVAATCVMNTTITVTMKKRREIGILTALGTRAWQIIAIFVSQAAIVALIGVVTGIIGGFAVLSVRNDFRDWVSRVFHIDLFAKDIYFLNEIPAHTDFADLAIICGTAIFLCLLAAVIPSWFAARVDPAVALRD